MAITKVLYDFNQGMALAPWQRESHEGRRNSLSEFLRPVSRTAAQYFTMLFLRQLKSAKPFGNSRMLAKLGRGLELARTSCPMEMSSFFAIHWDIC